MDGVDDKAATKQSDVFWGLPDPLGGTKSVAQRSTGGSKDN